LANTFINLYNTLRGVGIIFFNKTKKKGGRDGGRGGGEEGGAGL
jgi:hypothetical protein